MTSTNEIGACHGTKTYRSLYRTAKNVDTKYAMVKIIKYIEITAFGERV
jgi:hypothetical protein